MQYVESIPGVGSIKRSSHMGNPEMESSVVQRVTDPPKHQFQWSRGVATCSCGYWTLWGADNVDSARRDHALHRRNRWEVEAQPMGQIESDVEVRAQRD